MSTNLHFGSPYSNGGRAVCDACDQERPSRTMMHLFLEPPATTVLAPTSQVAWWFCDEFCLQAVLQRGKAAASGSGVQAGLLYLQP